MIFNNWYPFAYFMIFLVVAVGWRAYRVWRQTGVNALTTYHNEGVYGLASTLFRLVFAGITITTLLNALPNTRSYLTPIVWLDQEALIWIGWILLSLVLLLVIVAQVHMGVAWRIGVDFSQDNQLVTEGVFRYSRNPIFLGIRLAFIGLLLVAPNAWLLAFWLLGDAMIQIQVRLEEAYLLETFGDQYKSYMKSVRRWV